MIEVDLGSQPSADDLAEYDSSGDNDDDDLEEDEEDEVIVPVSFKCSISKAGGALIFDCQSDGESIEINHVSYEASDAPRSQGDDEDGEEGEEEEEKGEIDEDTENYSGPDFDELDETLQQAFLDYLEERGVTSELGQYLRSACVDKSSREYVAWLQKVRDWVSK